MKKESAGEIIDFIKWFPELNNKNVNIAGGKGASLAEMYNNKFPVPPGFIITAGAYSYFIEKSGLKNEISNILDGLDIEETEKLENIAKEIREKIEKGKMPDDLADAIVESYEVLDVDKEALQNARGSALGILNKSREGIFVAVRSSATTEDLADASFAGQQETFLNVKGKQNLLKKVKACFASLFTARAVYYRTKKGFSHIDAKLAVVVQKMIDSDKSGVMFSKDPTSNENNVIIEAVWGLGEGIVSGRIKPDYYKIKGDLSDFEILDIKIAEKKTAIVRNSSGENEIIELGDAKRKRQVLNEREIKNLAVYAKKLEEHYEKPQDIEFSILANEIYIVQSRPITTSFVERNKSEIKGKEILSGLGASPGISSGVVKIIHDLNELNKIKKGDVLVTEMTNPDMVVSMQKAAAIVTDEGGITSHASIVSREMGIPCVVGTGNATSVLQDGSEITIDGSTGKVYEGRGETHLQEIGKIVQTKTKIKVIVDLPEAAERATLTNAKDIGLLRLEGIIAKNGKHPLYYINNGKSNEYTEIIFKDVGKIAENFNEIWVRSSDLRSDEFGHIEGAPNEKEGNPMLGNHGIRFSLKHPEIHISELKAIKKLAEIYKNKRFGIMIPQVISVDDVKTTKKMAMEIGMPKNVKIGIMVETPAAVQIINEICEEGIDFASFGTNDLTQYMLAIDRNNPEVQDLFNEMNPAVISALSYVIRRCKKFNVETSICGQAGSKEEMARFLVKEGISSISVNADAAEKVSRIVAEIEKENYPEKEDFAFKDKKENKKENISFEQNEDIENIVLKELSGEERNSDDYVPGLNLDRIDIPVLNDSIPINSEMFDIEKDNREAIKEIFD